MKQRIPGVAAFLCTAASLVISLGLFYQSGVFVDAHNLTPADMYGGAAGAAMDWLRLALLAAGTILSGWLLLRRKK